MTREGHITVTHGSLTVEVPRNLFRGWRCEIVEERAAPFRDMLHARYPWLSESSVDVLMSKARKEMIRVKDEETAGLSHSRCLAEEGRSAEAISHLRLHLESDPLNADCWYALGELLCKNGDMDEGFKAINRGREIAFANQRRGR